MTRPQILLLLTAILLGALASAASTFIVGGWVIDVVEHYTVRRGRWPM